MIPSRRTARRSFSGLVSLGLVASVVAGLSSPSEAFTPEVKASSRTIAAGDTHTLVLTPDGRIYGAGATTFDALPPLQSGPETVNTLTLLDPLPGGVKATAVAAGQQFSLALGDDGAVYGAGFNGSGQLTSAYGSNFVPVWTRLSGLPPGTVVTQIVASGSSTIVLTSTGQVYGSGLNTTGQLTGSSANVQDLTVFTGLPAGVTATMVAAGGRYDSEYHAHTLVLGSDGVLYGTGSNSDLQLSNPGGVNKTTLTPFTQQPPGQITAIAAGGATSYAVVGGEAWSWGSDADGQRGTGLAAGTTADPVKMTGPANTGIVAIAAGDDHVAVISSTESGSTTLVAGANGQGQLAQGASFADRTSLVATTPATAAPVEIAVRNAQTIVRTRTGEVLATGYNHYRQLTGTEENVNVLTSLAGQRMIAYGAPLLPAIARFDGPAVSPTVDRVWSVRPTGFLYRWYVDDVLVASSSSYLAVAGDVGRQLRVEVRGTRFGYATTDPVSSATVTVQPGLFTGGRTAVSGTPGVGRTLTVTAPTVTPAPDVSGVQWLRNGVPIAGATGQTYLQVVADAGLTVSATFTATRDGYAPYVSSAAAGVVPLHATKAPRIKGAAKVGTRLRIRSKGSWAPRPSSFRYQWLRNGKVIQKATKTSYRLTRKDKGRRITLRVTARRGGVPAGVATSRPTTKVKK